MAGEPTAFSLVPRDRYSNPTRAADVRVGIRVAASAEAASLGAPAAAEVGGAASSAQVRPPDSDATADDEPPKKVQVNTSRCWTCNRKIGLTGFQCKCEAVCGEGRLQRAGDRQATSSRARQELWLSRC